jgi:hypothetical protein
VKYMLLMSGRAADMAETLGELTPDDMVAHVRFMHELNERLAESGELVEAQGLTDPSDARFVQAQPDGSVLVTDGPFPESKEFLAGYWVLDCESPERVYELAAYISVAPGKGGAPMNIQVEVRPIGRAPEA